MADYIERSVAIDANCSRCHPEFCTHECDTVKDIRAIPPADVVERKKGKWIEDNDGCLCCSLCGNACEINCITGEFFETPFCSQCGAEMEGE